MTKTTSHVEVISSWDENIHFSKETLNCFSLKTSQSVTLLDRKSLSCNTPPKRIRLLICQNQWYFSKETESSTSNLSARAT